MGQKQLERIEGVVQLCGACLDCCKVIRPCVMDDEDADVDDACAAVDVDAAVVDAGAAVEGGACASHREKFDNQVDMAGKLLGGFHGIEELQWHCLAPSSHCFVRRWLHLVEGRPCLARQWLLSFQKGLGFVLGWQHLVQPLWPLFASLRADVASTTGPELVYTDLLCVSHSHDAHHRPSLINGWI